MFRFSLRKMLKNRWLTISLLIGYLMAVAIVASMPVYSHAILDRMLQKDLEAVQTRTRYYPGYLSAEATLNAGSGRESLKTKAFREYDQVFHEGILADISVALGNMRVPIHTLMAREGKDGHSHIQVTISIGDLEQLRGIMSSLRKINGVITVQRSSQPAG